MRSFFTHASVLKRSILWLTPVLVATALLQIFDWHILQEVTSLHSAVVSGGFFIVGFILSATIADYKESERLPAEFAATATNMYQDIKNIGTTYPEVDTERARTLLLRVLRAVRDDVLHQTSGTRDAIYELGALVAQMERAGVPANFIVKLKQEQAQLVRSLMRIQYIQRIQFIPSAFLLARIITVGVIGLLLVTKVEPVGASILAAGLISFVFIYLQSLLNVIRTPFHPDGHTQDDVSMFLVNSAIIDLDRPSEIRVFESPVSGQIPSWNGISTSERPPIHR